MGFEACITQIGSWWSKKYWRNNIPMVGFMFIITVLLHVAGSEADSRHFTLHRNRLEPGGNEASSLYWLTSLKLYSWNVGLDDVNYMLISNNKCYASKLHQINRGMKKLGTVCHCFWIPEHIYWNAAHVIGVNTSSMHDQSTPVLNSWRGFFLMKLCIILFKTSPFLIGAKKMDFNFISPQDKMYQACLDDITNWGNRYKHFRHRLFHCQFAGQLLRGA